MANIYQLEQQVARIKLERARLKAELRIAENALGIAIIRAKKNEK